MKIKNFALTLVVLYFLVLSLQNGLYMPKAYAEGVSLRSYPSLIQIKAETASVISPKITVENLSDSSVDLNTQIKLFKPTSAADGEIEYLGSNNNPNQILSRINLLDNGILTKDFSLGPKQKKEIVVQITLDDNDLNNDYYFSVIFLTKPKEYNIGKDSNQPVQSGLTTINMGFVTNVLLSVGASTKPSANIEEFSAPSFIQRGPLPFTVKLQNNDSKYINASGNITITNMFGQKIGKVEIPSQNILAHSSRYLFTPNQSLDDLSSPNVFWKETFLLGFYKADLSVQLSDNGPTLARTIHFWAFPLSSLAAIIATIIILLLIYTRVQQKLSS